jgi:hypothetical protein
MKNKFEEQHLHIVVVASLVETISKLKNNY